MKKLVVRKINSVIILLAVLTLSLISITNLSAECTTTVPGGTISGQRWTKMGSPYCVEGDIYVKDLVIEPGVRVEFSDSYVLKVDGVLTAIGTNESPIIFTAVSGKRWQGILFDHTPAGSKLKHCQIEYSEKSAVRIIDSIPTIENCFISKNHSDGNGGGMHISLTSVTGELIIRDCKIADNQSLYHGGGLYINASSASVTLENCIINGNRNNKDNKHSHYYGGGIYCQRAAEGLSLIQCDIKENCAHSENSGCNNRSYCYGGGLYIDNGNILMENCCIESNKTEAIAHNDRSTNHWGDEVCFEYSYAYGPGIYQNTGSLLLTNCIIANNTPSASGGNGQTERAGGIYINEGTTTLVNCTVAYNQKEGIYSSDGILTANNSIIYYNSGKEISGNNLWVNYCNVEEGWTSGEGNISEDPRFESAQDLKISSDSPCVDKGNPYEKYNDMCFPPSFGTEINDIGAHGGPGACGWGPVPFRADLDKDGDVDGMDLVKFSDDFGKTQ